MRQTSGVIIPLSIFAFGFGCGSSSAEMAATNERVPETTKAILQAPKVAIDVKATLLTLNGVGQVDAVNEFLRPYGLESEAQGGVAPMAVSMAAYDVLVPAATAPYREIFVTLYVKPIGSTPAVTQYVFFSASVDNAKMRGVYLDDFRMHAGMADFTWSLQTDSPSYAVKTGEGDSFASAWMAGGQPTQTIPFKLDTQAYSLNDDDGAPLAYSYHFVTSGVASARPFDATNGDIFEVDAGSELGGWLSKLSFVPTLWLHQKDVRSENWPVR